MKVYELIARLQQLPQDMEVITEGCDCDGEVGYAVVDDDRVLLARPDADYASRLASSASESRDGR